MPKISVISCSIRPTGIALVEKALKRQQFQAFEWIIQGKSRENKEGEYWTIYTDYNEAVKKAKGELIVSIQDHTSFKPDALDKFWQHYQDDKKSIVSGVGGKYTDDTWTVQSWADPRQRADQGSFYQCSPEDLEWNFLAIPKEAIYQVGGFDESLNAYSSLCGLDVIMRLDILGGWKYFLDQTNTTKSTEHGRMEGWEEHLPFDGPWQKRLDEYKTKPVLNYLQSHQ